MGFFGLSYDTAPQYRLGLFTQIHQIVFHGGGGYIWSEVYNMPIWLRKWTFNELQKHYEGKSKSSTDNPGAKTLVSSDGKIDKKFFKNLNKESNYK